VKIEKILEILESEKLVECLDLRDGKGNAINDQDLVDLVTNIYNEAINNCKKSIISKESDE
jgi:hypothetical protein